MHNWLWNHTSQHPDCSWFYRSWAISYWWLWQIFYSRILVFISRGSDTANQGTWRFWWIRIPGISNLLNKIYSFWPRPSRVYAPMDNFIELDYSQFFHVCYHNIPYHLSIIWSWFHLSTSLHDNILIHWYMEVILTVDSARMEAYWVLIDMSVFHYLLSFWLGFCTPYQFHLHRAKYWLHRFLITSLVIYFCFMGWLPV